MVRVQFCHFAEMRGIKAVESLECSYACPLNVEVESFFREKALDFTNRKTSITHLVFGESANDFLAYLTLAHKPLTISASVMSANQRKRMSRFAKYDPAIDAFTVSAFLIAQLGKNFANPNSRYLSGRVLLEVAFNVLRDVQDQIGGQVVFLECEKGNSKLLNFYSRNGFVLFGERVSEDDGITYLQLFQFLK